MSDEQNGQMEHIKGVIESLLFVSEKVVTLDQIKEVLPTVNTNELKRAIKELSDEYEEHKHGMLIKEIAGGYQMFSNNIYAVYIREFYKTKHKDKLSKPALETLAIIAYKQPITRADIELIRGVNCDGVVMHLTSKELIKIVGRKDIAGKPYLYGTTKQFMEYFGLRSLADLPKLEEFANLEPAYEKAEGGIPGSEVPMNSLEQMKQRAISVENRDAQTRQENVAEGEDVPAQVVAATTEEIQEQEELTENGDNQESA